MSICMVQNFQVYTDNNPLTYVLTTAKWNATGYRWVTALSNYTFSIIYKPGKGHHDADALSCIKWPEAMDISSQAVHAVCKGVQAPHGKIEMLLPWGLSSGCTGERQCATWHDTLRVVSSPSQGPSHQSNSRRKTKRNVRDIKK